MHRNEYRVLLNTVVNKHEVLQRKEGAATIVERTDEGIVFVWPLIPSIRVETNQAIEVRENQDYENYVIDGDWVINQPWMYFDNLDKVMDLLNQKRIPVSYVDLGWLSSIREARAVYAITSCNG